MAVRVWKNGKEIPIRGQVPDFNKLAQWAFENDLSLTITGFSNVGPAEIEVSSIYPLVDTNAERLYMKRCHDINYFIECWENQNKKEKS